MTKNTSKKPTNYTTHEAWFLRLSPKEYIELCKAWNSQHLKLAMPKGSSNWDFDKWFLFFSKQPASSVRKLQSTGADILTTEAFVALRRWIDIVESPHRIEKIHSSALSRERDKGKKTLLEMAHDDDTIGVLEGMRDDMIVESEKASPKDKPNYARAIKELMEEINETKRRQEPSKKTKLGKLIGERTKGNGADGMSFKSRILIEDVEK